MIDTIAVKWQGITWAPELADWLREEYPTAHFHQAAYDKGLPWEGVTFNDEVLGTLQVASNKRGNYLRAERSLPKFMYGDNCRLLSSAEATDGTAAWLSSVEQLFERWWEVPAPRAMAKVQRLDLCWQVKVPCGQEALKGLYNCLNLLKTTRYGLGVTPAQLHLTGCTLRQNRLELTRWYDKGWESGDERYMDVIRHEEQLRAGKAGYYLDLSGDQPAYKVEEARLRLNKRYARVGEGTGVVKGDDLGGLLDEHGMKGAAALGLVVRPDLLPLYKRHLSNGTYYRLRNLADEWRGRKFAVDMSLPRDAWAEPMVL